MKAAAHCSKIDTVSRNLWFPYQKAVHVETPDPRRGRLTASPSGKFWIPIPMAKFLMEHKQSVNIKLATNGAMMKWEDKSEGLQAERTTLSIYFAALSVNSLVLHETFFIFVSLRNFVDNLCATFMLTSASDLRCNLRHNWNPILTLHRNLLRNLTYTSQEM